MIGITDDNIAFAERILLPAGCNFDDERVAFIKDLNCLDVQAVPGSGKTTALLAKLLILESKLPFENGSGVLVLSHTNTAIDSINGTLKPLCHKLFRYPNFSGTIQSFIDLFLAIPYYRSCFKKQPVSIDRSAYDSRLDLTFQQESQKLRVANKKLFNKIWSLKHSSNPFLTMRFGLDADDIVLLNRREGVRLEFTKPQRFVKQPDYTDDEKTDLYEWAYSLKRKVLADGFLDFDDCYFLAQRALSVFPQVGIDLRNRFSVVLVDEMQDMSATQIHLLRDLFETDDYSGCFQRIGDINQAIHGESSLNDSCSWQQANRTVLPISGTHRFDQSVASIVENFALTPNRIVSLTANCEESPKLILYNTKRILEVLPSFSAIVNEHKQRFPMLYDGRYPIKAIGWRKENDTGIALKDYFPDYVSTDSTVKKLGSTLWAELLTIQISLSGTSALGLVSKVIWRTLFFCLKLERHSGFGSFRELQTALKQEHPDFYKSLKAKIYGWCLDVFDDKLKETHSDISAYVESDFLPLLGFAFDKSKSYFEIPGSIPDDKASSTGNKFVCPTSGMEIEVCTVHSAKGETHAATLYLETYYQSDGGKSYESQRLIDQLKGTQISTEKKRTKESSKMVYVGFSRPKHLLCFAANKVHFSTEDLIEIEKQGWEIRNDLCN